jgi:hypothetical protein
MEMMCIQGFGRKCVGKRPLGRSKHKRLLKWIFLEKGGEFLNCLRN